MAKDSTSLGTAITRLGNRYADLKVIATSAGLSDDDTLEVLDEMVLVNHKITQMENLRNHIDAGTVTVMPPSPADVTAIKDALDVLDKPIKANQKWAAAYNLLRAAFSAVRDIEANVRKRQA